MMTPRQRRMTWVALMVAGVSLAAFFALTAFQKNLLYFYTPSQVASGEAPKGYPFRIGGLVVKDSVKREPDSLTVRFEVSDGPNAVPVLYTGILPDLFREGQGIIAVGQIDDGGTFQATEVLAKHDENYMPPEVAESLKKNGGLPADYSEYRKK
ncbi:cytochrome c maturation protein CcmE [Methylococcus capsulatus]|uniref:Cytochrome c-type biogenesis protein CcmE n=1 Tax=Methylococcus capsulatus (strain ATCC 33009 / NCIMB 11132 / Bath) TaxID=243233 RepID=CCME_METCA|nr:cytochrome c maturation protein CcmE [Methylococcus capsulatus]Q60BP6.1 RecName: Full=Cytochrome c-type biogenesis protein CcmE; AltName: Full=Cytochrome c maturation protein E; AltName: Full=Heme chaperone CcmE [Methylococcus capsulatus str. Bath]AAU90413.1 cytochrome c-type biogenesis protein CcmE [Methylococcus capsulatus str. Bath]QXP88758.1 cytochrome c maturation protein CcmE [Methylococcus capsulatus]QXP89864.1 cytochrome c maturation protein CcmE [Methylococcus capsulatus]QXP94211.1